MTLRGLRRFRVETLESRAMMSVDPSGLCFPDSPGVSDSPAIEHMAAEAADLAVPYGPLPGPIQSRGEWNHLSRGQESLYGPQQAVMEIPDEWNRPSRGAAVLYGPLPALTDLGGQTSDLTSDSDVSAQAIVSAYAPPSTPQAIKVAPPLATVTGVHHEQVRIMPPNSGVVDLTGATFLALEDTMYPESKAPPASWPTQSQIGSKNNLKAGFHDSDYEEMYPLAIVGTGKNFTVTGGYVHGTMHPSAPWHIWKDLSDGDGLRTEGTGMSTVTKVRIDNVSDGYSPNGPAGSTFLIKDSKFTRIHDDIIEDDSIHSGTISNIYAEGHSFLSHRGGSNSSAVVNIDHVVVKLILQPHYGDQDPNDISAPYKNGTYTDHMANGTIFKWSSGGGRVNVSDSVFLVSRHSAGGNMNFPPGTYKNVTVVWQGTGAWPSAIPPGVTITRDTKAFDQAKAAWQAAHPGM